ncbi:MAG: hypothetical protein K6F48_03010 [Paludibacteraceae bacterium]|nr:hypothetical protein [Paludibacteraceae bacterium]
MSVVRLLLSLLICAQAIIGVVELGVKEWGTFFLINISLLALQFLVLKLVYRIKNKENRAPLINNVIGMGDVLFFIFLAGAFSPLNFIGFFTGSLIISLLLHLLFRRSHNRIPLIGYISIIYIIHTLIFRDNYNDAFLLSLLPTT